jgi:hypothetical protein
MFKTLLLHLLSLKSSATIIFQVPLSQLILSKTGHILGVAPESSHKKTCLVILQLMVFSLISIFVATYYIAHLGKIRATASYLMETHVSVITKQSKVNPTEDNL